MPLLFILFFIIQVRVIYHKILPFIDTFKHYNNQRQRGFHISDFIFPEGGIAPALPDGKTEVEYAREIYDTHMHNLRQSATAQVSVIIKEILLLIILFYLTSK